MNSTLSIVHPCYNPHKDWEKELVRFHKILLSNIPAHFTTNLILVDDGSSKGINQEHLDYIKAELPGFEFIKNPKNMGKGFALRTAMKHNQSDLIIYTDYDYPYEMKNVWNMFALLNEEKMDVVVGIRDNQYYSQLPFLRKFFSLSLRFMNHLFFPSLFVKDTQSGLKGFNQKGKNVFMETKINSFLFDTEFIYLASKRKDIKMAKISLHIREGIVFSTIKFKVIMQELLNFIKLT